MPSAAIEAGADDAMTLATAGFVIGLVAHDYDDRDGALSIARWLLTPASALALGLGAAILGACRRDRKGHRLCRTRASPDAVWARKLHLAYVALAWRIARSGNFEAAAAAGAKAAQANPRFSLAHVLHAAALSRLGRIDEARGAARRVLECEPDFTVTGFVRAHTGRAEIWEPIGDALRGSIFPNSAHCHIANGTPAFRLMSGRDCRGPKGDSNGEITWKHHGGGIARAVSCGRRDRDRRRARGRAASTSGIC